MINKLISTNRIVSIDLLRGVVMVIMALDHVRDYFHADAFIFDPVDLSQTNVPLFFTRWITHFCAPVFVFLAGTSAFLVGERKGKKDLSVFLLTRGLWLIFLEFTVVNFGWAMDIHFSATLLQVIWVLGASMVLLAAIIHLPKSIILVLGVLLVGGHNLLDGIQVESPTWKAIGWSVLHSPNLFQFNSWSVFIVYSLLPWLGVMTLGYCFGSLYKSDVTNRRRMLFGIGTSAIALFIILRAFNIYGDPAPWTTQPSAVFSFLSFLNTSKYPPSLLYILMTLGPAIVFLAVTDGFTKFFRPLVSVGRVPLFYYVLHIYLAHGLAILAAGLTGFGYSSMIAIVLWFDVPALKGYGFSLATVYAIWIFVVILLFPICNWYDAYKTSHREKRWLSYV